MFRIAFFDAAVLRLVVQSDDLVIVSEQVLNEVASDETCCTGN
jgi:hypothetical protein